MDQIDVKAQERVLSWSGFAKSVDKIDFLKKFFTSLNMEEIHHVKRLLGHRQARGSTKKRKWIGPAWDGAKKSKDEVQETAESRPLGELRPSSELRPPSESSPAVVLQPWWKQFQKKNTVAEDVEKINLRNVKGVARVKAAKIGIVNANYETVLDKTVYHAPGTFLDGPKDTAISGITSHSLENGERWEKVKEHVKASVNNKLVISVAGQNDFNCLELERDHYDETFDLQEFYRRPHPENSTDTQEMSLRDMYFYHFKEDCQFKKPHNAITDAKCTMKVFLEGYIPLKLKSGFVTDRGNVEEIDFSNAIRLKSMEKQNKFYCKPRDMFAQNCVCTYCKNTYKS